jgi:hypothetical protein
MMITVMTVIMGIPPFDKKEEGRTEERSCPKKPTPAGDKIMDITQAKAVHILATVGVYGCVAFLVIGLTAHALYSAVPPY